MTQEEADFLLPDVVVPQVIVEINCCRFGLPEITDTEIPLVALLGLVHLRIGLLLSILRRRGVCRIVASTMGPVVMRNPRACKCRFTVPRIFFPQLMLSNFRSPDIVQGISVRFFLFRTSLQPSSAFVVWYRGKWSWSGLVQNIEPPVRAYDAGS